ncbi:MAG: monovalent cation/H+ antiporter subunit D family protein, partial [Dietzia cercidiphylli]
MTLFIAVPLVVAGLLTMIGSRPRVLGTAMFVVLGSALAGAITLVVNLRDGGVIADSVALWPFGIAIPFV